MIQYIVQVETSRSDADREAWIGFAGPYDADGDEVSEEFERLVKQYSHRKVRVIRRETIETVTRRNYL